MKITILYHSETGNTKKVAELIAKGIGGSSGIECKLMSIANVDTDFLSGSQAVVFGCPTYGGTFSYTLKQWLDKLHKSQLEGKLGAVFATENYVGGGAELSLMGLIGQLLVRGMLVYSGGAAQGYPYTHFGAVCVRDGDDFQQQRAVIFGERIAKKAKQLFAHLTEEEKVE